MLKKKSKFVFFFINLKAKSASSYSEHQVILLLVIFNELLFYVKNTLTHTILNAIYTFVSGNACNYSVILILPVSMSSCTVLVLH